MKKIIASMLVAAMAFTTAAVAQPKNSAPKTISSYEVPKGERTVYLVGEINGQSLKAASKIERLSAASKGDINIFINSPGGMVVVGLQIIQAIDIARARGVKVVCSVGVLAASMAFQVLPHCDERYAMKHTLLLFHPARAMVQGGITGEQAAMIGKELLRIDARAQVENDAMMGSPSPLWLALHFRNETLWEAQDLVAETQNNWLTLVDVLSTPSGPFNLSAEGDDTDQSKRPGYRHKFEFDDKPWIIVNI
jgi:ATP-dependent protease ClpP protease subunit